MSTEQSNQFLYFNHFQVTQMDSNGQIPLHKAIIGGIFSTFFIFLDVSDKINGISMFSFVNTGHKKAIEMLIDNGSDINAGDIDNMTPLHYIVSYDSSKRGHSSWTEDDYLSKFTFYLCCFLQIKF